MQSEVGQGSREWPSAIRGMPGSLRQLAERRFAPTARSPISQALKPPDGHRGSEGLLRDRAPLRKCAKAAGQKKQSRPRRNVPVNPSGPGCDTPPVRRPNIQPHVPSHRCRNCRLPAFG